LPSTAKVLADKYGVGEMTIKRDGLFAQFINKIVEEYGDQEVKRRLLGADVKLTQGSAKVLLKLPAKERKATVDQLVEKGELARAKKGTVATRRPKEVAQSLVSRLKAKGEGHARSVLQQMARMLGMKVVVEEKEK